MINSDPRIERLEVASYRIPTDAPESDGTLCWDHTDLIVVHAHAGGLAGVGWTYASPAVAQLVTSSLTSEVTGKSALQPEAAWLGMIHALRNVGLPGAGSMGLSAVDIALWDLKAKVLNVSLVDLFGGVRDSVPVYGSGGFTSYDEARLCEQLSRWAEQGMGAVKMKVGRVPAADVARVRAARAATGPEVELFVDANGAYSRKQALQLASTFGEQCGVSWFEEPRPSSDLDGLRWLRDRAPASMEIAAGEYGDTLGYFRTMLLAGALDCLQADATRCGGFTGFLKVAALCQAFELPLSAHCAPELHAHVGCAVACLRHVEYFHDHVRIAGLLFDGVLTPKGGALRPDRSRLGHGLALKVEDAARFRT
ncbi:MAG: enolase C-terminal domain-like protein [Polyangiaceae bacterium]